MKMTETEKSLLEKIDGVLRLEKVRAQILPIVGRVDADLGRKPDAMMTWEPIPLTVFGNALGGAIKSSWVFVLRAGTNTGPERHPNSHQRMVSWKGSGDMQMGDLGRLQSNVLISDLAAPLEKRWISIPKNVWHQPVVANESDWAVVSFHTVPAEELIEERPDPSATTGTKRMAYLEKD